MFVTLIFSSSTAAAGFVEQHPMLVGKGFSVPSLKIMIKMCLKNRFASEL